MIITDYDPSWPKKFEELKAVYKKALGNLALVIEHVGSTSIPEIKAKPNLDIDIVIKDYGIFPQVVEKLAELGYRHNGDQGVLHREAFKRDDESIPFTEPKRTWMNHSLYVCPESSEQLKRHLLFRDYLRINDDARNAYQKIKEDIVARSNGDRKTYVTIKEEEFGDFFEKIITTATNHAKIDTVETS
ncbi:MAG: GrpB family protein [Candidatus Latescibacteria bacterium]|nr:GrpB family protein [Candidatus Latescibacterota bacterium]